MLNKLFKKVLLSCVCILGMAFVTSPVYADSLTTTMFDEGVEHIETVTAEEYFMAKSEATGIPYSILIKEAEDERHIERSGRATNTVYKKYYKTFTYSKNSNYKADIGGYFTLKGYGNYYDITECTSTFTRLSSAPSTCEWVDGRSHYSGLSASSCTLIGGGRFRQNYSIGVAIPNGFSVGGTGYVYSSDLDMRVTVTAAQLKSAQNV